jgi:hypothetical protein
MKANDRPAVALPRHQLDRMPPKSKVVWINRWIITPMRCHDGVHETSAAALRFVTFHTFGGISSHTILLFVQCRSALPSGHMLAFSRHEKPESCVYEALEKSEGAGKAGYRLIPMAPVQQKARGRNHRLSRMTRPSLRDGVNAYNALSRVNGLSCHPDRRITAFRP